MAELSDQLRQQISASTREVERLESQMRAIQADVHKLPFLARGFVERDVSSTGRNLAEWAAASQRLLQTLTRALAGGEAEHGALAALLSSEVPRMAVLRGYLEKAPQKVGAVPAAVLKPQQRAEFLAQVRAQVVQLQSLEQELRAIAAALPRI